jgi:MFS family permease
MGRDRFSRRRVVTLVFVAITTLDVTLAIALALDAPTAVVIAVVAVASVAAAPYRPAQLALAPLVARSADELVAINVTAGTLEGVVTFVGPALAGLLLLGADPWVVMAASSVAALGGLVSVLRIRVDADGSSRSQGPRTRHRYGRCSAGSPSCVPTPTWRRSSSASLRRSWCAGCSASCWSRCRSSSSTSGAAASDG